MAFFSTGAVPGCAATTGIVTSGLTGAPSKPNAGTADAMPAINTLKMVRSNIRITLFLVRATRMGHRTVHRWSHLLGILPQRTRPVIGRARLPFGLALGEFGVS